MPLVKSPRMTSAKLAANRANARKCTGPRTPEGKRRVTLNALKHGRYARTAKLLQAGADAGLLAWIRSQIVACYQPQGERGQQAAEQLTREVYCSFAPGPKARRRDVAKQGRLPTRASLWALQRVAGGFETKPRYAVKSVDSVITPSLSPRRVRLLHPRDQRQLVFWVRARRDTVTLSRLLRMAEEVMQGWAEPQDAGETRARQRQRPILSCLRDDSDRGYRNDGVRYENSEGLWAKLARLAAQVLG